MNIENVNKTETKEAEANRQTTRSGKEYGPPQKIIRDARFVLDGNLMMHHTMSEVSLTKTTAAGTSARTSIEATMGSKNKDTWTNPMESKLAWENYETSLLSSTVIPGTKKASAIEKNEAKITDLQKQMSEMAQAISTLCSQVSKSTESQTRTKTVPAGTFLQKWTEYRKKDWYQSTETLASRESQRTTRHPKLKEQSDDRRHRRENDEKTSESDMYEPEPDECRYPRRRAEDERSVIRYATRVETRNNPFDDLRYAGRTDKKHPMRFLEEFDEIAEHERMKVRDQFYFFKRCLIGKAREWYDNQEFAELEEARMKFKQKFWSRTEQQELRDKLRNSIYQPNKGRSMAEYAEKMAKDAKHLTPRYNEFEMVEMLSLHFPVEVYEDLAMERVSTMEELTHRLNVLERKSQNKIQIDMSQILANRGGRQTPIPE